VSDVAKERVCPLFQGKIALEKLFALEDSINALLQNV
jgi:hypothetical protein